jgi:hypothetical protein
METIESPVGASVDIVAMWNTHFPTRQGLGAAGCSRRIRSSVNEFTNAERTKANVAVEVGYREARSHGEDR